jgi:hypothetical protein
MRQNELLLIEAANEFACGTVSSNTLAFVESLQRPLPTLPFNVTHLCALNTEVNLYNAAMLADVQTRRVTYVAEDAGDDRLLKRMLVEKVHIKSILMLCHFESAKKNYVKSSIKRY